MSTIVLRPNGTTSSTGVLVGAASAHAALSDDSDASYIEYDNSDNSRLTLGDLTLPAGGVIITAAARARCAVPGAAVNPRVYVQSADFLTTYAGGAATVSSPAISTYAFGAPASGPTDAQLDAATLLIEVPFPSSLVRIYEAYVDVKYVAKPVIVVGAPTGTLTTTNMPLVSWTDTLDPDGGPQGGFRVKIFSAAQYGAGGFDPATSTPTLQAGGGTDPNTYISGTDTSWQPTTPIANATYRAYVQVFQGAIFTGGSWQIPASDWTYSGFTINVPVPAVPTITVTAQSSSGRNQIVLSSNAGAVTTDALDLERSMDAGVTWLPVRHSGGLLARLPGTSGTFYDYEAPNGVAVLYRARALHDYSGLFVASAWTSSASGTWSSTSWWLKHPLLPSLNRVVELVTYGDVMWAARQGSFQPLGAAAPIVVADTRAGATGASTIRTRTTAARDELRALASPVATLMLQGPLTAGEPDRYIRVGDLSYSRVIENVNRAWRTFTLPWAEVEQPDGAAA